MITPAQFVEFKTCLKLPALEYLMYSLLYKRYATYFKVVLGGDP